MKKFIFSVSLLTALAVFGSSGWRAVQAAEQAAPNLKDTITEVESSQNVTAADQLHCNKVTDNQFEKLGDAVMETLHPGSAHEYMDKMMGGEGSESLKIIHIRLGQQYLGCGSSYAALGLGYGMMGGNYGMMGGTGWGMMGGIYNNVPASYQQASGTGNPWYSMMGILPGSSWPNLGTGMIFIMLLFWIIIILGIAWLIKSLWRTDKESKVSSALEILQERYAKGDISQAEFESKKKALIN